MIKAFVVGHPIQHSRSPLIHGAWLKEHGIAGSYERIDVLPEDFPAFLRSFPGQGFVGGNVTIPHKEAAFAGAERRTDRAERMGAVNTLWIENGVLWGDNTDILGFMANLDENLGTGWEAQAGEALVIGAGGAARAVVAGLLGRSLRRVTITNRTPGKAEEMIASLGFSADARARVLPWDETALALAEAGLIVNTTSLGMKGHPPLTLDLDRARADAVVADIVYVPLITPLLEAARGRGLRIVDGLGMLLHQAVPGFQRWFGVTPRVTPALRALVEADIEGRR